MSWDTPTDWDSLSSQNILNMVNGELIDFTGQEQAKQQLSAFMKSQNFPNTLIVGEAGLGKTYLAKWIAGEKGRYVQVHRKMPITRKDLSSDYKFVILDECHLQKNAEWLYPYMEDTLWTFIGTTNLPEKLSEAFKSRFVVQIRLRPYTVDELTEMAIKGAPEKFSKEDARVLASAAGGNPRQLERIMLTAKALGSWEPATILSTVRINADGVTEEHLMYLSGLEEFDRPVGVQYLSATTGIDTTTLKSLERLLSEKNLISLLPNGRTLTIKGHGYLDLMRTRGLLI
jgi:Holliday junction resolvasome RuvABC ATP-dependent DNA helicase subunit